MFCLKKRFMIVFLTFFISIFLLYYFVISLFYYYHHFIFFKLLVETIKLKHKSKKVINLFDTN